MEREQTNGFEVAKDKALHILARRRHTKKELSEKLVRAGFLTETADAGLCLGGWVRLFKR